MQCLLYIAVTNVSITMAASETMMSISNILKGIFLCIFFLIIIYVWTLPVISSCSDDVGEEVDLAEDDDFVMEETEQSKKAKEAFKRVTFDLSDESEGEDVSDILGGKKKSEPQQPSEIKSSFEKREEKVSVTYSFSGWSWKGRRIFCKPLSNIFCSTALQMAEKIQALQKQMLEEKPWQLGGEVTAQKRPENSLLSESLLFEHASRMGKD